jgi:hypothetical protein
MKKIIVFTTLLLSCFNCATPQTSTIKVGSIFTTNFQLVVEGNITGLIFDVKYDSTKLEYVSSIKKGKFDHENIALLNGKLGDLVVGLNQISSSPLSSTNISILELNFKALKAGATQIIFDKAKAVNAGIDVESVWNNLEFTVNPLDRVIMTITIKS